MEKTIYDRLGRKLDLNDQIVYTDNKGNVHIGVITRKDEDGKLFVSKVKGQKYKDDRDTFSKTLANGGIGVLDNTWELMTGRGTIKLESIGDNDDLPEAKIW